MEKGSAERRAILGALKVASADDAQRMIEDAARKLRVDVSVEDNTSPGWPLWMAVYDEEKTDRRDIDKLRTYLIKTYGWHVEDTEDRGETYLSIKAESDMAQAQEDLAKAEMESKVLAFLEQSARKFRLPRFKAKYQDYGEMFVLDFGNAKINFWEALDGRGAKDPDFDQNILKFLRFIKRSPGMKAVEVSGRPNLLGIEVKPKRLRLGRIQSKGLKAIKVASDSIPLWIPVQGRPKEVMPANNTDFKLREVQKMVGGYVEVVYLRDGRIMLVDEEGLLKGSPLNREASRMAGRPIVGPAVVMPNDMFR